MKAIVSRILVLALVASAGAAAVLAQDAPSARDEALRNFSDAADKAVRLAEAIPADKYGWRPGEGVRSVSEVLMHLAAGNFNIPRRLGAQIPAGIEVGRDFDKSQTEKAKVVEILKMSVDHVKKAYAAVDDAEKTSPWFGGRQASMREIMFFIASHNHEHLGQLIAYARVGGVTPPWTEEAAQRQQQQPAKRP